MKEVFFNSLTPSLLDADHVADVVNRYAHVVKRACLLGYNKVRYQTGLDDVCLTQTESLKSYCGKHSRDVNCMLLLNTIRHPYIGDEEDDKAEQFVNKRYNLTLNGERHDELCFCAAYISNSFLVGLDVKPDWRNLKYSFSKTEYSGEKSDDFLYCVVDEAQYDNDEFSSWIVENDVIDISCIRKSTTVTSEKKIHLRDDHGKDVLSAHAAKLLKSPYVEGIINSTPFKPNARRYIDKVNPNGQIEIVLMKTEAKIGMVVQTTGSNIKETNWIANELSKRYAE